jgi:hypothetical protein
MGRGSMRRWGREVRSEKFEWRGGRGRGRGMRGSEAADEDGRD